MSRWVCACGANNMLESRACFRCQTPRPVERAAVQAPTQVIQPARRGLPVWGWILAGCGLLGLMPCVLGLVITGFRKAVVPPPKPVVLITWDDLGEGLGTNQRPARGRIRNVSDAPVPDVFIEFWGYPHLGSNTMEQDFSRFQGSDAVTLQPGQEAAFIVPLEQLEKLHFPVAMNVKHNRLDDVKYEYRQSYQGREVTGYLE